MLDGVTQFKRMPAVLLICLCFMLAGMGATALAADGKININTATHQELTMLKGIGPELAKRIVQFREEHGPFATIRDLQKVRGIGEGKFLKLQDAVSVTMTTMAGDSQ